MRRAFATITIAACVGLSACGPETPQGSGRTAVINMDQIAAALGRDQMIQSRIQAAEQEAEQRLNRLREELQQQLETKRRELGENPTDAQQEAIGRMGMEAEQRFRQEVAQVQEAAARLRAGLVSQFREEVRPSAERIGKSRGFAIVLIHHDAVLSYQPDSDITLDVIEELKASGSAGTGTAQRVPPTPSPLPPGPLDPAVPGATAPQSRPRPETEANRQTPWVP
jgi:Skp family chaperone for outer membrane proteins